MSDKPVNTESFKDQVFIETNYATCCQCCNDTKDHCKQCMEIIDPKIYGHWIKPEKQQEGVE